MMGKGHKTMRTATQQRAAFISNSFTRPHYAMPLNLKLTRVTIPTRAATPMPRGSVRAAPPQPVYSASFLRSSQDLVATSKM